MVDELLHELKLQPDLDQPQELRAEAWESLLQSWSANAKKSAAAVDWLHGLPAVPEKQSIGIAYDRVEACAMWLALDDPVAMVGRSLNISLYGIDELKINYAGPDRKASYADSNRYRLIVPHTSSKHARSSGRGRLAVDARAGIVYKMVSAMSNHGQLQLARKARAARAGPEPTTGEHLAPKLPSHYPTPSL